MRSTDAPFEIGQFQDWPPDLTIGPGDRVRSYDFVGRLDCFFEGVVTRITEPIEGCPRYELTAGRRVLEGREVSVFETAVYPPVNGTPSLLGGLTNFVVKLDPLH